MSVFDRIGLPQLLFFVCCESLCFADTPTVRESRCRTRLSRCIPQLLRAAPLDRVGRPDDSRFSLQLIRLVQRFRSQTAVRFIISF